MAPPGFATVWSALRARARPAKQRPASAAGDALCYFLVCFKDVEYVSFLLASLYREGDLFIVHVDNKSPSALKTYIDKLTKKHGNIVQIPSRDYSWAGFSHVAVTLEAMRAALSSVVEWSHFICLSEQHLPLKSPEAIAASLKSRKSLLAMRPNHQMAGGERADMDNRFAAIYRELPGVGCFAVALANREPDFLASVHHGSNWMTLCRAHCVALRQAQDDGQFARFHDVVHAEETAIQTMIARFGNEVEHVDATLVAWPHLTDNHSLVMSEALFRSAIESEALFIRKRPEHLTDFERDRVTGNYFRDDIHKLRGQSQAHVPRTDRLAAVHARSFVDFFDKNVPETVSIEVLDPTKHDPCPQVYLVVRANVLRQGLSVRVVSENLSDYKICIVDEAVEHGAFQMPYVADNRLHATLRTKMVGLFGHREILPLDIPDGGFVSIRPGRSMDAVAAMTLRMFQLALAM